MSSNTKWVLLFALLMAGYAASQYFEEHKGKEFKSPLLAFLPEQISVIKIHPAGNTPFQLLRLNEKWLLSVNNIHEPAEEDIVNQLLKLLKTIRTTEITSQKESDWSQYELESNQGTLICLESTHHKQLPCVRFGSIQYSSSEKALKGFARLDKQKEIYSLNGFAISSLQNNFNDYRNKQILKIDAPIIKLRFTKDTVSSSIFKWNEQWVNDDLILEDSNTCESTIKTIANIKLTTFADDLDELALANSKVGSLQVFTKNDSFELEYFMDSTYALPHILHSDQFPKTWMACDSTQVYELLPKNIFNY